MVVFGDTLTKAERALVANGKEDSVTELRHEFQMVMKDDLVGIVEDALDRIVKRAGARPTRHRKDVS